ncbi:hypothetical protein [Flavobacterium sp. PS2]|uniref:hypothetical protein n=1 Tax=Flavobacterium sp. PS2 TaxID=3384157 RepID=UPI00390C4FC0
MQSKQKSVQILGFTSLSTLLILIIIFIIAPAKIEDFCKFSIVAITPLTLLAALILSTIAVYYNKRHIFGWISLLFIIAVFSITTYLLLGSKILLL